MQIKKISFDLPDKIDVKSFVPPRIEREKTIEKEEQSKMKITENWQKNILLDALESLENSIQMDNTHPLDNPTNAPIETFKQALKELRFVKTDKFKQEALKAHSNIDVENIVSLFTAT